MIKVSSFVERGVIGAKQHRETHVQESYINFLIGHFTGRINVFANSWETWVSLIEDQFFSSIPLFNPCKGHTAAVTV
jgi:hypothetical protein